MRCDRPSSPYAAQLHCYPRLLQHLPCQRLLQGLPQLQEPSQGAVPGAAGAGGSGGVVEGTKRGVRAVGGAGEP
jgi:hypothetical protein